MTHSAHPTQRSKHSRVGRGLWENWRWNAIAILAGIGAIAFGVMLLDSLFGDRNLDTNDGVLRRLELAESPEEEHVRAMACVTRKRVFDIVHPAMKRTQLLASDPEVIEAMRTCDKESATELANRLVSFSTEVDVAAIFSANGTLCGFNSVDASGKPFPAGGIESLYAKSFLERPIVSSCLRQSVTQPALEFQLHCDFTPALHNSVGLSVAYSVPVDDPDTGLRLGVVSARLWFDRLLSILPTDSRNFQAVFVSESGDVFEESVNPRGGPFPIPPEVVRNMRENLDSQGNTQQLFLWDGLAVDLALVADEATMQDGALYVLSYADAGWITQQAREDRTLAALAGGGGALLVLSILSAAWLVKQRRFNRDLALAQDASEAANHAKSDFLAAMSHEIRTPMNGVIGMVDVLMQSSLRPNQMDLARAIRTSADALLHIVGDILDFSKIEAGKLELAEQPMSIEEVVEGSCALLAPLMAKKKIQFTFFVDPAIPARVLGDPNRLRQVIVNLLSNAVKFSGGLERRGRVALRATVAQQEADRDWVEISIVDNGIGMSPSTLAQLSNPSSRAVVARCAVMGALGWGWRSRSISPP